MPSTAPAPLFSVIMNVYNGEPYLRAAIDSVLAQSCQDWELILYDDCSTDGSAAICLGYDDPRIRYLVAERQVPVAQAREQAIAHAHAPWIAFLDQDDIWLPEKLAAQAGVIAGDASGDLGLVHGRTECFDAKGRRWHFDRWNGPLPLPEGSIVDLLLERPSFIALSSLVIRRSAVLPLLPMPPHVRHCPDYFLCLGVARTHRSACVQDLTTLYRVHGDNMTHRFRGPIHAEIIEIIRHAAGPQHAAVLRRRSTVHNTWIAVDQILSGKGRRRGLRRLLTRGSVVYLAARPVLLAGRSMMQRVAARRWKYRAIHQVRRMGLLRLADGVKLGLERILTLGRNAGFRSKYPDFPVPPTDLAFDAYNTIDWETYRNGGLRQAAVFAGLIDQHGPQGQLRVLEWGCGPGRLIRHMGQLLGGRLATLTGTDYNERTIAWCRGHLPGITFLHNDLMPPLPVEDASIDAIYCLSVFTHLSEPVQLAWARELQRVLVPGGLLVCTTHGDKYRYLLTDKEEQRRYDAGESIEQAQYAEGRKWYFAVHPPAFVRNRLLAGFTDITQAKPPSEAGILQDVWIARKPAG